MILDEARSVTRADAGAILLWMEDRDALEVAILRNGTAGESFGGPEEEPPPFDPVPLDGDGTAGTSTVERRTVDAGTVLRLGPPVEGEGLDFVRRHFHRDGTPVVSLLSAPLMTQEGRAIGVLQLVNARGRDGSVHGFPEETLPFIEALCSDAAVALDNRRLLKAHKDLLESFIHVLAGAIDAKSPHTHGHCSRVPVIARMLAEAAQREEDGPFAAFHLSGDEWNELHMAAWLHDCGKVTTPEYVVHKATKLETLHNRIHEIRTRFEVLWRDTEIAYLREVLAGGDREAARRRLEQRQRGLQEDFAFLARCNLGDDPLSDDDIRRIRAIGSRTWLRHFDDRLGLSHGELRLREGHPPPELPATEHLLADRPGHRIPREPGQHPFGEHPGRFRMEVPELLYDRGELHNLTVRRGTLTEEERFKINEHIIQTLRMLERLPFPRELRRVPRLAGTHHEKLDGSGYPRRLGAEELSIPERIMAVADVFEALTATDRPYQEPRTLGAALRIMRSMADSGHLCPRVFALFLRSGVYREYAATHLDPAQVDQVDVEVLLEGLPGTGR